MKIAMLCGAYKNAGDFLIVKRCKELLNAFLRDCEIKEYDRKRKLDDNLEEINKADILLFAGGPAFMRQVYPDIIPLVDNLDDIKPRFFAMAMGWYGRDGSLMELCNYRFTPSSMDCLKRFTNDGYLIGTRDQYTTSCLRMNGFDNSIMTGCAAWYNLEKIGFKLKINSLKNISKICISDPAKTANFLVAHDVVEYLKEKFPFAKLYYIFHRGGGGSADEFTPSNVALAREQFCRFLDEAEIEYRDISYSAEGFSVYDDCDMHVGFRVHAHLYCLSGRIPSILLEEDGRGTAANYTLGLPSIPCYNTNQVMFTKLFMQQVSDKIFKHENSFLLKQLDDWLKALEDEHLQPFVWCFSRMEYYFENMKKHICSLN